MEHLDKSLSVCSSVSWYINPSKNKSIKYRTDIYQTTSTFLYKRIHIPNQTHLTRNLKFLNHTYPDLMYRRLSYLFVLNLLQNYDF